MFHVITSSEFTPPNEILDWFCPIAKLNEKVKARNSLNRLEIRIA